MFITLEIPSFTARGNGASDHTTEMILGSLGHPKTKELPVRVTTKQGGIYEGKLMLHSSKESYLHLSNHHKSKTAGATGTFHLKIATRQVKSIERLTQ